jgi:hypothetical protein
MKQESPARHKKTEVCKILSENEPFGNVYVMIS